MATMTKENYTGYGEQVITLAADSTVTKAGVPVKLTAMGTVGICADKDVFIGVVLSVNNGYAAVQTAGTVSVKKNGDGGYGFLKLTAGPDGTIKTSTTTGREHLVFDTDDEYITFVL